LKCIDIVKYIAKYIANLYHSREYWKYRTNLWRTTTEPTSRNKGFARDSGLCCWFQRISSPEALASYPRLFETFIVGDVTNQLSLMSAPPRIWHWRTSSGAEVDLVLERDGFLFPIEVKCKSRLGGHDLSGISAFMKTYPDRTKAGVVIYAGRESYKVAKNITAVPWSSI
jgi:predicted AAA+ superfamily ATPase